MKWEGERPLPPYGDTVKEDIFGEDVMRLVKRLETAVKGFNNGVQRFYCHVEWLWGTIEEVEDRREESERRRVVEAKMAVEENKAAEIEDLEDLEEESIKNLVEKVESAKISN